MDGMKRVLRDINDNFEFSDSGELVRRKKEEPEKEIKFFEFNLTVRASSVSGILGELQKATKHFVYGDEKFGSWCGDKSNYFFILKET